MVDTEQLKSQRLFPARKLGDALIVEPKGELRGFGRTVVDGDVKGVLAAVRELEVRVVVLNLGSWNYFGSEMIGLFFDLRRSVPEDVKVVICEASRDMRTVLETMQVHQIIPVFATQKEALGATAHITMRDRLPSRRYLIPIVMVICLLVVVVVGGLVAGKSIRDWSARLQATPQIEMYQRMLDYNNYLQQMRADNATDEEWAAFTQRVRDRLNRFRERQRDAETVTNVDRLLMGVAETFLRILEDPRSTEHDAELFNSLTVTQRVLEAETGLEVEAPPPIEAE